MKLTPKAIQICEDNYNSNCGKCPLRPACVTPYGPGQEGLDRWMSKINELAETLD